MKELIISTLALAIILLLSNWSFAGWNEDGFKSSPLFAYSLNNAIDNLQGKASDANNAGSNGAKKDTSGPGCVKPRDLPTTPPNCPNLETCEGEYTCVGWATCMGNTCQYQTCPATCSGETCESTCEGQSTCQGSTTCDSNCPPWVSGTVKHQVLGGGWSSYWGPDSYDRIVVRVDSPGLYTCFRDDNGFYQTDVFGTAACNLLASGKISGITYSQVKGKPHQDWGEHIKGNFKCRLEL